MKWYKTVTYEIAADSRDQANDRWATYGPEVPYGGPVYAIAATDLSQTRAIVQGIGGDSQ